MHWPIDGANRSKKINRIETYFAYRLPHQSKVYYLKGKAQRVAELSNLPKDGIVINSFDSNQILIVTNLVEIDEADFDLSLNTDALLETTKFDYQNNFEQMHSALQKKEVEKVVLSRIKKIKTEKTGIEIFKSLNQNYAATYNYILSNPEIGTWLGASPELLLRVTADKIKTVSLAGTKQANANTEWTEKEITEQKIVTDFILNTLKSNDFKNINSSSVQTVKAGTVEHLKTEISADVKNKEALHLLLIDLHPTPATCGLPKDIAFKRINEIEHHDRKFYTGFIGILRNGQQDFFVNLRCMELSVDEAVLYIGGGLTIDSHCESEWQETERKSTTLSNLL